MYLLVVVVVKMMQWVTCRPQKEWTEILHLKRRRGMDDNGRKVNLQHYL
jgi:hypothetical protein